MNDEIRKATLRPDEMAALQRLLDRIETDDVLKKDTKYLKAHKLWEARLDGDRRIFRLLFAKRGGQKVLVGLVFTAKKKSKLPEQTFATARARLKDWDSRH